MEERKGFCFIESEVRWIDKILKLGNVYVSKVKKSYGMVVCVWILFYGEDVVVFIYFKVELLWIVRMIGCILRAKGKGGVCRFFCYGEKLGVFS